MLYRVHSRGKDLRTKGDINVDEVLNEGTSLRYVGRASRGRMGPTVEMTEKGIETLEQEI
jgi:hypothetical protein